MVKKMLSSFLLTCMVLVCVWIGKKEAGQEQAGSNPYFYDLDEGDEDYGVMPLEAQIDYESTEAGFYRYWCGWMYCGIQRLDRDFEKGTGMLYEFYLPLGHNKLFLYVTSDKIYRVCVQGEQEIVWRTEKELIENSDIVCQSEEMEAVLPKGAGGTYIHIQREGVLVTCSRCEMEADGEAGFHETFVWKEGGGLVEYRNGYGEEAEDFCLEDIELSSIRLFGTWRMDEVAVISTLYERTPPGAYIKFYDSADYIGLELEYTPQMMRLGEEEYESPAYQIQYDTVLGIDHEGGRPRFEPHLHDYLLDKGIEVKAMENPLDPMVIKFFVEFEGKVSYGEYPFIPVGAACILLNDDTMLVGVWGKLLLAHRVE